MCRTLKPYFWCYTPGHERRNPFRACILTATSVTRLRFPHFVLYISRCGVHTAWNMRYTEWLYYIIIFNIVCHEQNKSFISYQHLKQLGLYRYTIIHFLLHILSGCFYFFALYRLTIIHFCAFSNNLKQ